MKVFVGNKLEKLVQCLAGRLDVPLSDPFAPERIVVQSTGMAKWLSLQIALRQGIAANYRFPFPRKILEDIFSAFIPDYEPDPFFQKSVMTWAILEMLPELIRDEAFSELARYLGKSAEPMKMYQLAGKIASAFDQYLIFRPQMILDWEKGKIEDERDAWQSLLWRELIAGRQGRHAAGCRQLFLSAVKDKPCRPDKLPERLSVFGISYLPPFFLEMFSMLAAHRPVDCYYWNPSPEFWADIRSGREIGRVIRQTINEKTDMDEALLHLESGNALLASWGRQGRDIFQVMENISVDYIDAFETPAEETLLQSVQSAIYLLSEPAESNPLRLPVFCDDDSLQIHVCHSPLREVEVLHDALLSLFEKNAHLTPEDVLVMTPDIEVYASYVEAVFDTREPKIPYTIADRGILADGIVCGAFWAMMETASGRFAAQDVLSILENPAIAENFAISISDLDLIRSWVEKTRIKWGIDAAHRQKFDLPAFEQNTWRQGLNRLLAGFALDGRRREFWKDILPYPDIEAPQIEALGKFLIFWQSLVGLQSVVSCEHSPDDWYDILQNAVNRLLPSKEDYLQEISFLKQAFDRMRSDMQQAGFSRNLDWILLKDHLTKALRNVARSSRFLAGGVSFCAMLPMRNIPFDVIVLLGMQQDAFPRRDKLSGFNVLERTRQTGDRSQRNDDQYLFLESLLSANKHFILTYVGQSEEDNSHILPSVLVSELTEYLDRNYATENGQSLSEEISRKHPLHGFSSAYFRSGGKLKNYSNRDYQAAQAVCGGVWEKRQVVSKLPESAEIKPDGISMADLKTFFRNPVKYFLQNRLGMKLPERLWEKDDESEPFSVNSLSAYQIRQELVEGELSVPDEELLFRLKQAEGVLPVGGAGKYYFNEQALRVRKFADRLKRFVGQNPRDNISVDLQLDGYRLFGSVDRLTDNYRMYYRMAALNGNDYMDAWISHLVCNAVSGEGCPQRSLIIGERGAIQCYEPVKNARDVLVRMIRYYKQGQSRPLHFFPRSSWEYARMIWERGKSRQEALEAARDMWLGDHYGKEKAEGKEAACRICFENDPPFDEAFEKTAQEILQDLFAHLKKAE